MVNVPSAVPRFPNRTCTVVIVDESLDIHGTQHELADDQWTLIAERRNGPAFAVLFFVSDSHVKGAPIPHPATKPSSWGGGWATRLFEVQSKTEENRLGYPPGVLFVSKRNHRLNVSGPSGGNVAGK